MNPQRGRYELFADGVACGEERWRIEAREGDAAEASGEQETRAPHPFPSLTSWRAALSPLRRVTAIEIDWRVGDRRLRASHAAAGDLWRVRVEHQGHTREQEGDCPSFCEILFGSHVFLSLALQRYVWAPGAAHEFPAIVIGPPWMAAEPGKQRVRCTAAMDRDTPFGPRRARRLEVQDLGSSAPPFVVWASEDDLVLESFEDEAERQPWMRLVEWERC